MSKLHDMVIWPLSEQMLHSVELLMSLFGQG
jgi:hypothetical protein